MNVRHFLVDDNNNDDDEQLCFGFKKLNVLSIWRNKSANTVFIGHSICVDMIIFLDSTIGMHFVRLRPNFFNLKKLL